MLTIPWSASNGWDAPQIQPCKFIVPTILAGYLIDLLGPCCLDGPLSLEPSCTVFHYAQTLFEGMKAYRQESGKVTLFRPDMNMKRMQTSAKRIALPVSHNAIIPYSHGKAK